MGWQNHIGFKHTSQRNIICILHYVPFAQGLKFLEKVGHRNAWIWPGVQQKKRLDLQGVWRMRALTDFQIENKTKNKNSMPVQNV